MRQILKPRKTNRSRPKSRASKVKIVKTPLFRHLRLIEHKHTGKLVSHSHTSHGLLVLMLAILGFFMYISSQAVVASQQAVNSSVNISLVVPGPAPEVGATITSPKSGDRFISTLIIVNGTCKENTFVVIKVDGQLAGSTICTSAGIFILDVQIHQGKSVLSAMNYDNLNQPGPATDPVEVSYVSNNPVRLDLEDAVIPVLPDSPLLIPGLTNQIGACSSYDYAVKSGQISQSSVISICTDTRAVENCSDYRLTKELPTVGDPHVVVVCTERYVNTKDTIKIGILAWGGKPPYALSVDWNDDDDNTVISIPEPAYVSVEASYSVLGVYNVKVLLTDKEGNVTNTETSLQVNGSELPQSIIEFFKSSIDKSWFETPVPIYLIVVAITLGFWGGDLFYRHANIGQSSAKKTHRQ